MLEYTFLGFKYVAVASPSSGLGNRESKIEERERERERERNGRGAGLWEAGPGCACCEDHD